MFKTYKPDRGRGRDTGVKGQHCSADGSPRRGIIVLFKGFAASQGTRHAHAEGALSATGSFSFSLSMGESTLDGQSGRTLDCFVVNNSCFNSVAPGDARGAKARAAGPMSRECAYGNDDLFSTGDTKGSSDMRQSVKSTDKYGHVENAR
jgi:hypothetical protein